MPRLSCYYPASAVSQVIHAVEEVADRNYEIIRDYSIKQWIMCCDKIYTWYSTSVAEIYLAKKTCTILRPYEIDENMEIRIYQKGKFIKTQEEFEKDYLIENKKFPLDEKLINYYYNFKEEYSYCKKCSKV